MGLDFRCITDCLPNRVLSSNSSKWISVATRISCSIIFLVKSLHIQVIRSKGKTISYSIGSLMSPASFSPLKISVTLVQSLQFCTLKFRLISTFILSISFFLFQKNTIAFFPDHSIDFRIYEAFFFLLAISLQSFRIIIESLVDSRTISKLCNSSLDVYIMTY